MNRSEIETTYISDDLIIFKTTCSCQHNSMTITVDKINKDDDHPLCEIFFHTNWSSNAGILLQSPWYYKLWHNIIRRLKACFSILLTGNLECNDGFLFRDQYHLDKFIEALKNASESLSKKN